MKIGLHDLILSYYSSIILNSFSILLFPTLCWHISLTPSGGAGHYWFYTLILYQQYYRIASQLAVSINNWSIIYVHIYQLAIIIIAIQLQPPEDTQSMIQLISQLCIIACVCISSTALMIFVNALHCLYTYYVYNLCYLKGTGNFYSFLEAALMKLTFHHQLVDYLLD